ncbi:MAG: RIP metalloprotease RseP [Flammeovirgaceae bacterium]
MEGIVMIAQMLLGLSLLVGLHELGHMLAAKAFGMRVEKFSIGFPPKIFAFKYGETDYSLGALPLGGFVKISGMIDESLDKAHLKNEPQPWEFRSKPAWQRLIVMLGGIIFNVITGVCIFIALAYSLGEQYLSKDEANKHGIYVNELGKQIGLQTGDKIIKINGRDYQNFNEIRNPLLLMESNSYYTVLREGKEIDIKIPNNFIDLLSEDNGKNSNFVSPLFTFHVGDVKKDSPAEKSGLKKDDKIIAINGFSFLYFQIFKEILNKNANKQIQLTVISKDGVKKELNVNVTNEGTIGFVPVSDLKYTTKTFSFFQSIPKGIENAFQTVWLQIKAFGKIFKGEMSLVNSLGGPVEVAQAYGGEIMWERFWTMTGFLSMVLAFMNLLPIPALDGGHVMFISYEIISGKAPSQKVLEVSQKIGMVLLLSLMVFVIIKGFVGLFI